MNSDSSSKCDFENVENLSPSESLLTSDKSEKGKPNDRAALISLLNLDVKGNETVSNSPDKPQPELKEPLHRDVVQEVLQAIVADLPLDSSTNESCSLSPAVEENSIGPTLCSSSENTWKSCSGEGTSSPSHKQIPSLNNTSSDNNFETATDLSSYSLPSSKEVSFTLPLDDYNNPFDTSQGNYVLNKEQPLLRLDLNITVVKEPFVQVQENLSLLHNLNVTINTEPQDKEICSEPDVLNTNLANELQIQDPSCEQALVVSEPEVDLDKEPQIQGNCFEPDVPLDTLKLEPTEELPIQDRSCEQSLVVSEPEVVLDKEPQIQDPTCKQALVVCEPGVVLVKEPQIQGNCSKPDVPLDTLILEPTEELHIHEHSLEPVLTVNESEEPQSDEKFLEQDCPFLNDNSAEVPQLNVSDVEADVSGLNEALSLDTTFTTLEDCPESDNIVCEVNKEQVETDTKEPLKVSSSKNSVATFECESTLASCDSSLPILEPDLTLVVSAESPVSEDYITNIVAESENCSNCFVDVCEQNFLEEPVSTEIAVVSNSPNQNNPVVDVAENSSHPSTCGDLLNVTQFSSCLEACEHIQEPIKESHKVAIKLEIQPLPNETELLECPGIQSGGKLDEEVEIVSSSEDKTVSPCKVSSDSISNCTNTQFSLESHQPECEDSQEIPPIIKQELFVECEENSKEIPPIIKQELYVECEEVSHAVEIVQPNLFVENNLNQTYDFLLDNSLLANPENPPSTPVKSLLDSTFNLNICESVLPATEIEGTVNVDIERFPSYESPKTVPSQSLETVVLNVPNHNLSPSLFTDSEPDFVAKPSDTPAKEHFFLSSDEDSIEAVLEKDETHSLLPERSDPTVSPVKVDSKRLPQIEMPIPKMEPQESNQWHPESLNGDDNRSVDVNVNPCTPIYAKHNDGPQNTVGNHVISDSVDGNSVTSSPNKRKNEEDSAFEDCLATEDANSDLVDDHLMEDPPVDKIGVAAVSRRSPSRSRIAETASSKPLTKPTPEAANKNTFPNESEAGPEVAEFTEEEFRCAAEVFKDPSTFEFLQRAGNTRALEDSALSRLSLYVKFDPLVSQKSPELRRSSTFKVPAPPQKKSAPPETAGEGELISLNTNENSQITRRESDANKLIDFHSPPSQVTRATPKMVPVEPVQRIEDNLDCKKLFTEEDMKKALQINELLFQERLIKKEKEISDLEQQHASKIASILTQKANLQQAAIYTRGMLEESGRLIRQWQEKKELERKESTRERDQALEDLKNVEASFSELHRRYEKIKNVLEGYKTNEDGLRIQLHDTQGKLQKQEQMYETLKGLTHEKLENANTEIENAKQAGGSEIAVLRSQLMKAEMKITGLERSLDQKGQEYAQLSDIYDDLIARVSRPQ